MEFPVGYQPQSYLRIGEGCDFCDGASRAVSIVAPAHTAALSSIIYLPSEYEN
jgi:hypothetical protein